MRLREIHFWTAIAVIGICGFAAVSGWSIARFSLALMDMDSSKNQAEARMWTSVPGVASTAWRAATADKINPSDLKAANDRREALSAFLLIKPLSSYLWLVLSGMELATAQPMEEVLDTLRLSALTGPNEGYVMEERGIFGVSLWENLSPDLKSRAALDLVPLAFAHTPAEGAMRGNFQAVLASKPQEVRDELRTALLAAGLPRPVVERLGI